MQSRWAVGKKCEISALLRADFAYHNLGLRLRIYRGAYSRQRAAAQSAGRLRQCSVAIQYIRTVQHQRPEAKAGAGVAGFIQTPPDAAKRKHLGRCGYGRG